MAKTSWNSKKWLGTNDLLCALAKLIPWSLDIGGSSILSWLEVRVRKRGKGSLDMTELFKDFEKSTVTVHSPHTSPLLSPQTSNRHPEDKFDAGNHGDSHSCWQDLDQLPESRWSTRSHSTTPLHFSTKCLYEQLDYLATDSTRQHLRVPQGSVREAAILLKSSCHHLNPHPTRPRPNKASTFTTEFC